MSNEQLENLEQLGRRAVACKHFRWMPGMRTDEGWRVIRGSKESRCWAYDENPENWEIADNRLEDYNLPDLSDPATIGCLLALVRWAWDSPSAYAMPWGISPQSGTPGGWSMMVAPDDTLPTAKLSAPTEAAALVAALEAAP